MDVSGNIDAVTETTATIALPIRFSRVEAGAIVGNANLSATIGVDDPATTLPGRVLSITERTRITISLTTALTTEEAAAVVVPATPDATITLAD